MCLYKGVKFDLTSECFATRSTHMPLRLNSIMIIPSIVFLLLFISIDSKNSNDDKLVFVQVVSERSLNIFQFANFSF